MCNNKNKIQSRSANWDNKFGVIEKPCGFKMDDDKCGYALPDTILNCTSKGNETECPAYIAEDNFSQRMREQEAVKVIDGVGADAETVTNEKGGKQSKSPMAMHLLDPNYLIDFARNKAEELEYEDEGESTCVDGDDIDKYRCYRAIEMIGDFMLLYDKMFLQYAMDELNCEELQQIISIAKVLQYGASRYEPNNWRLIPQEEHINHALIHIIAHLAGDTQDEHIDHALCRLMMAYSTKRSENFNYGAYVNAL